MSSLLHQRAYRSIRTILCSTVSGERDFADEDIDRLTSKVLDSIERSPAIIRVICLLLYSAFSGPFIYKLLQHALQFRHSRSERFGKIGDLWSRALGLFGNLASRKMIVTIYSDSMVQKKLGFCEGELCGRSGGDSRAFPPVADTLNLREFLAKNIEPDVIIIGSGPGGSMAALRCAQAGLSTVVFDKGMPVAEEITDLAHTLNKHYAHGGFSAAFGDGLHVVPILFGHAIGGSSTLGGGAWVWPSKPLIQELARLGVSESVLLDHSKMVDHLYGVAPADRRLEGKQNEVVRKAFENLGIPWEIIRRNAINRSSASVTRCGGSSALKLSADRVALRSAVDLGASVVRSAEIERITFDGHGRATAVQVKVDGKYVSVSAKKAVILAGGTIGSPLLLKHSGLTNQLIGSATFFQNYTSPLGDMPNMVNERVGIESSIFSRLKNRILIEADSLPAGTISQMLPGFGAPHWQTMKKFNHLLQLCIISDADSTRLRIRQGLGMPLMDLSWSAVDIARIKEGLVTGCKVLFEAGALRVLIGRIGWFDSFAAAENAIANEPFADILIYSVHPLGTCRMSDNPKTGVVDADGLVYGTKNLYILDGSIIPVAPEANPTCIISTLSSMLGAKLAQRCQTSELRREAG